jgi:hypothetical protein
VVSVFTACARRVVRRSAVRLKAGTRAWREE